MIDMDQLQTFVQQNIDRVNSVSQAIPPVSAEELGADQLARRIDHTLLKADATQEQVIALCQQAHQYHFASVCVNPVFVPLCYDLLKKTDVAVCSVIGFPLGATLPQVKVYEAEQVMAAGASEIDMVIHVGALKGKAYTQVYEDIAAVAQACHLHNAILKVIIEAAMLTDNEKIAACCLAQKADADFVKTSTGFGPGGATIEDVTLMRKTIGPQMELKAAGGIRSYQDALNMIRAGATRIGASAGIKIIRQALEEESP